LHSAAAAVAVVVAGAARQIRITIRLAYRTAASSSRQGVMQQQQTKAAS